MSKDSKSTKVVIKKARLSFPILYTPEQIMDVGEPKYQATFLIPKSDKKTIKEIKAAIKKRL